MDNRKRVVVIGAGMGGLTAAVGLARRGFDVTVVEARSGVGGLASGFQQDGFAFDAGPYILLDRPGLDWAFRSLGLELDDHVALRRIEDVYEVASAAGPTIRIHADLDTTAAGFDRQWPGSGRRYVAFVRNVGDVYRRLQPMLHAARPGLKALVRHHALGCAPFLMRSLGAVLEAARLPRPLVDALGIWTRVAAQTLQAAPSPMAFVPALIHSVGAFYPVGGVAGIPAALARAAAALGVAFRFGVAVRAIRCERGQVVGVETDAGELLPAHAVVSNASGVGTYLQLLPSTPAPARRRFAKLPLQSPGACAYLAIRGEPRAPYLRFHLSDGAQTCRLLIEPAVMDPTLARDGWRPARLLSPMPHDLAEQMGPAGQRAYLDRMLAETWWREPATEFRTLATRIPAQWGADFHLYRDSMNPVMTARFMRSGRIAHRSPHARGLYLAGSATHPGQWVSFCAISGVLAAELVGRDLGGSRRNSRTPRAERLARA